MKLKNNSKDKKHVNFADTNEDAMKIVDIESNGDDGGKEKTQEFNSSVRKKVRCLNFTIFIALW